MKNSIVRVRSVDFLVDFCYFSSCEVGNTRDCVRTQEPIIDFQVAFLFTYDNLISYLEHLKRPFVRIIHGKIRSGPLGFLRTDQKKLFIL